MTLVGNTEEQLVPIDPSLTPETRDLFHKAREAQAAAAQTGIRLCILLAQAVAVGTHAAAVEVDINDFVLRLLKLHGVPPEKYAGIDPEKGLIRVRK